MTWKDERAVERMIAARAALVDREHIARVNWRKGAAEGGCGVIGIACSVPIAGRHLLQALRQMRNRGNGKGGGAALVGLAPEQFGVSEQVMREDYLLAIAYLDEAARAQVEAQHVERQFEVDHLRIFRPAGGIELDPAPPLVVAYFVRPRGSVLADFAAGAGLEGLPVEELADEFVYQNSFRMNKAWYASLGEKKAFVLSHGKDMLALKLVGYGDDVFRAYELEDMLAHVWIGHHRYPTKGRVWHPGGAHPFVGMHEALVHNGDFANYASVCTCLAQHNIEPLFLTDTEVSVLVFDLLHRTFGYPLEYVIEALAPTTERDFAMLPAGKQAVYRQLQATHIHASPDGPWFFLIAQSAPGEAGRRMPRLIGITDTSMLRPQVFALQQGEPGQPSIGFAASEKQAIDAALESLAAEDARFWSRADRYWNARGGSHTDGGAFIFSVRRDEAGAGELICADKFGRRIEIGESAMPLRRNGKPSGEGKMAAAELPDDLQAAYSRVCSALPGWDYEQAGAFLDDLTDDLRQERARSRALDLLTTLLDRRYPTGNLRRSSWLTMVDEALEKVFRAVREEPGPRYRFHDHGMPLLAPGGRDQAVVLEARRFATEGPHSLAREVVRLVEAGFGRVIVVHARGHRFIANGLGPASDGVRIDVYGSSGDYLASGIDGAVVVVHGSGQDQLAQIMKRGKLVVHGDVGQTFMYAAKGGEAYVLGNAAGRPLINAVGSPRVVINGTCLDYLAESFMAGDVLNGGGFVILNGVAFDETGRLRDLEAPYPGGNLFSLASGGAIFVRDPRRLLGEDQLNGGAFTPLLEEHWERMLPYLQENERLFGISIERLLTVGGERRRPQEVYRAILPARSKALQPEELWVTHGG